MGVLLQAFYRVGTGGVPSPIDGATTLPWWWDHLAAQAHSFAQVGFTALWLPPPFKGASGGLSIGYDVFDDYDLGSKPQRGTTPTRYGTRERVGRCVATLRSCGLEVVLDLVENQRSGGNDFRYRYRDATGGDGGRFPKDPPCFHPNVAQDPGVFGGGKIAEASFGDDLAPINAKPPGYVSKNLIDAAAWVMRTLDAQGVRIDDAKGISTEFVARLLNSGALAGRFAVGEFFDGDVGLIRQWLDRQAWRASAFDFPLRFALARMCNQPGGFDMGGTLDHPGLVGSAPLQSVTFVENHDTDTRPDLQPVIANKMLAYAYILTSEGYPCVFYKDYSPDRGCYGLKPFIDNLVWVHEKLAAGPTVQRWKQVGLFVFERVGGPRLLVGLNKDDWQSRTVTVDTGFGANVHLHDYTGHAPDVWTDGAGRATITVPPNRNGLGYACFSRAGQDHGFTIHSHHATQDLEGAADLDVGPASGTAPTNAGRVWSEKGKNISARLASLGGGKLANGATLQVTIRDPTGKDIRVARLTQVGDVVPTVATEHRGWHDVLVQGQGFAPASHAVSFTLAVTYTAPLQVSANDLR